jgi:nitroimidazol reductase NimA-like FMN-containing flavoprotein (pyridoxamine 5'-phosphate oxidase superfamily)
MTDPATDPGPDLAAVARAIIEANAYVTLATADADGRPWASPVFYGHDGWATFLWMSLPDARHSRNLAARAELGLVVFDSTVAPGAGQAVYMAGTAAEVPADQVPAALAAYPGPNPRGARSIAADQLVGPAPWRLYRATVAEHSVLCPRGDDGVCRSHGTPNDHRVTVQP